MFLHPFFSSVRNDSATRDISWLLLARAQLCSDCSDAMAKSLLCSCAIFDHLALYMGHVAFADCFWFLDFWSNQAAAADGSHRQSWDYMRTKSSLSRFASVVLLRGTLSRPRRKNILKSIFSVFTADMVLKKGAPPVKTVNKEHFRFLPFVSCRGYGRRKSAPPVKPVNTHFSLFWFVLFLSRIWY